MYGIYILGAVIALYVIGSLRVLKQYERGVVFLLGRLRAPADPGSRSSSVPSNR